MERWRYQFKGSPPSIFHVIITSFGNALTILLLLFLYDPYQAWMQHS